MVRVTPPQPDFPVAVIAPDPGEPRDLAALERDTLLALYREHAAILLRGFALDLASFSRFCRGLCPTAAINESPGREMLEGDPAIQSVNTGADAFPLHPELAREAWKPDTAFFACLSPPGEGGETTICDGAELVKRLPASLRGEMAARRLLHVFPTWPDLLDFWLGSPEPDDALLQSPPPTCPYRFRRLPDGRKVRWFTRPFLHTPMFAAGPAFGNFLLFARDYLGRRDFPLLDDGSEVPDLWIDAIRAAAAGIELPVAWREGDVLMLDNTRFLHGRRAIRDTAERRIATYFGYLAAAPRNEEEPEQPPWRSADFTPPLNPLVARAG